jgi:hypothetical protein
MCEDGRLPPDPPTCPADSSSEEEGEADASKRRPSRRKRRAGKNNGAATNLSNHDTEKTAELSEDSLNSEKQETDKQTSSIGLDASSKISDSQKQGSTNTEHKHVATSSQSLVNGSLHSVS